MNRWHDTDTGLPAGPAAALAFAVALGIIALMTLLFAALGQLS